MLRAHSARAIRPYWDRSASLRNLLTTAPPPSLATTTKGRPRVTMVLEGTAQGGDTRRNSARGALVVFEGGDRCGKTTQTQQLVEALKDDGVKAELWR